MRKAVAAWRASYYSAALDSLIDLTGNGLHARLGSAVGADTNDPLRLQYAGMREVYAPGSSGNYISTPDAVANRATTELDLRMRLMPSSWTDTNKDIFGKYNSAGNLRSYVLATHPSIPGVLTYVASANGTAGVSASSSVAVPFSAGQYGWIRVNWRASDQRVQFFTAADAGVNTEPNAWTQLGNDRATVGISSLFNSSSPLIFGGKVDQSTNITSRLCYASIRKTIDAVSPDQVFDSSGLVAPYSNYAATTGETWTLNRSASGRKLAVVDRDLFLLGTDDYFEVADSPLLNFGDGQSFTIAIACRQYATQANFGRYIDKLPATNIGWSLLNNGTTAAHYAATNGTSGTVGTSGNANPTTPGVAQLLAATLGNSTLRSSTNGVIIGGISASGIGSLINTDVLRIGRRVGGTNYADFEFLGAAIFREALSADQLRRLAREFGL